MLAAFILMASASPAYAPAPIPKDTVAGEILALKMNERTITLRCNRRAMLLKVAPGAKVTINGTKGYAFDDLDEIDSDQTAILTVKMDKGGVVRSLDIKLTLANGQSLWQPGHGPNATVQRMLREETRKTLERLRQRE